MIRMLTLGGALLVLGACNHAGFRAEQQQGGGEGIPAPQHTTQGILLDGPGYERQHIPPGSKYRLTP